MSSTPLVLLWDNFGPLHNDRIEAVQRFFGEAREVIGVELCGRSDVYGWETGGTQSFRKETLFEGKSFEDLSKWQIFRALNRLSRRIGKGDYFFCHWENRGIFLSAIWLRLTGRRVFTMGCSKFDDKPRSVWIESIKSLFFLPYNGALGSGDRSIGYFRYLGFKTGETAGEYNTVSLDRIRHQAGLGQFSEAEPDEGPAHYARGFLCVARLVEKKNHKMLIDAYAEYCTLSPAPRPLELCGNGPLENELKAQAVRLGVADRITFSGFTQSDVTSQRMAQALALLLPSLEEQFGNVVPEAQALGLPVVISDNAGARDKLVRTAVNGFLIEADNPKGLAFIMYLLETDETLWQRCRAGAFEAAPQGDVAAFAQGIAALVDRDG
ncbi:MAG: glycosyltransferase [Vannielia sp.]|uniref:glycosyltransferase n=1 Tax=Vannielia sp. TaxID=2813045 RepID=UPI003B8D77CE